MVLISTYWNVNYEKSPDTKPPEKVLISTYWNVNTIALPALKPFIAVLISTYWNVNVYISSVDDLLDSFNLNLLECKSV